MNFVQNQNISNIEFSAVTADIHCSVKSIFETYRKLHTHTHTYRYMLIKELLNGNCSRFQSSCDDGMYFKIVINFPS